MNRPGRAKALLGGSQTARNSFRLSKRGHFPAFKPDPGHYSMTSSAATSKFGGMTSPSAFAVLRLMTFFEPTRLHHRQVARLLALENAASINANLAIGAPDACPVAHQPAISHRLARFVDRRQGIARREGNERHSIAVKERTVQRDQDANMLALGCRERRFQFALVRDIDKQYFSSECGGSTLDSFPVSRVSRFARPSHKSDNDLRGHQLRSQFQTLLDKLSDKETHTGNVAAGPVEACNEAESDGIAGCGEYDGNGCRRSLG